MQMFDPNKFYGGFDPRLLGVIHSNARSGFFFDEDERAISSALRQKSYKWNTAHLGYALHESAYVHETVHMLQHFYCPSMQMILPIRDRINVLGSIAFNALRSYPWGTSRNEQADFGLLPLPLMKWLKATPTERAELVAAYESEAQFLGLGWLNDSGVISTFDRLPTFDLGSFVLDPEAEATKSSAVHHSARALYVTGSLYGLIEAIMDHGGVSLVSETAAIAAQLEFVCVKMGPDAALAVADTLLSHPFYERCGELIWRYVDRRAPSWEQFMRAFVVATWCLMSEDVRPIVRFEIACKLPNGAPPTSGGRATMQWLDRFSDKPWKSSIFAKVKDVETTLCETMNIHEDWERTMSPTISQHFKLYRGTVINLVQKYSTSLIDETDWLFKPEFLRSFTQAALQENLAILVPSQMSDYSSVEDWLHGDRGISFVGVNQEAADTLIGGYYFSCVLDALFLGDAVNPLPIGDYAIKDFLNDMAIRPLQL